MSQGIIAIDEIDSSSPVWSQRCYATAMGPRRSRNGVAITWPCYGTCLVPDCFWLPVARC